MSATVYSATRKTLISFHTARLFQCRLYWNQYFLPLEKTFWNDDFFKEQGQEMIFFHRGALMDSFNRFSSISTFLIQLLFFRGNHVLPSYNQDDNVDSEDLLFDSFWWMSSTLKKRRAKMNKHKLKKRRKKNRMKTRK